jgi:hypothetical protein
MAAYSLNNTQINGAQKAYRVMPACGVVLIAIVQRQK